MSLLIIYIKIIIKEADEKKKAENESKKPQEGRMNKFLVYGLFVFLLLLVFGGAAIDQAECKSGYRNA